ncbi:MAG: PQQ-binding-like beta-propeller repeat protein [Okeania sp. SIO2C2]|uniref:S-layer homology domain-containing protein n=1 Tax=Okeania sp. SIO2C2 TaxID=2607787 RepID=UPI0013BAF5CF|nr:S-layer homology domain-containing protein [Okeania sp. SIO2C2]NEP89439.1 PQQ-binding-like beta-propeller repeat protein [Okeania sp. SIO2C2]
MIKNYKWHPVVALVVTLSTIINPKLFDHKIIKPALGQTTLKDIQNHFAQACIEDLLDRKIISGDYENQTFRPNAPVTRAEFAAMITRAFPDAKLIRDPIKFVDIPQNYWAYNAIQKSYEMGFLSGYIGKTFNPTLKITRWQVLTALSQGLNYRASASVEGNLNTTFEDAEAIPEEAKKSIAAATAKGIVVNYPNVRKLNPNRDATRSEVATFLCQSIANFETNNNSLVSKVPSEYIAKIDIDTQSTTTATAPETTPESTANTNSETTPESSTENTEPPGIVERFGNGNLQAEIIYEQANNTDLVSNLNLKIIRDGEIILNEPIPVKSLAGDSESDTEMEVLAGEFVKVQLLDLDGNGESEVLVDLMTINNSDVVFDSGTYSLIYLYEQTQNKYSMLRHFWGNVNYRLTDLDRDNIPEFKSVDGRFTNVFSNINDARFPIRIWQYRQGEMVDVTRQYPVQINTSASELWLEFYQRSSQNQNVKGVLAAYLANKYLLGQKEDGWKLIEKVYQNSDREVYFDNLRQFLVDQGYDSDRQISGNVVVPENTATENQETVTFATNDTEEISPQTTRETENTLSPRTLPLETTETEDNTETQQPETSPQATTETENTLPPRILPPETEDNTETQQPETSPQATTETENTLPPRILPPETEDNTETQQPETSPQATTETENTETQPDISNDLVLAPRLVRSLSNQQPDSALSVTISFDGEILASSRGQDVLLWNLQTGKLLDTLSSHQANVRSVAISPDGKTLASGSGDGTVKLWDIPTGEMLVSFLHSGVVTAVGFTADGRAVIGCSADRGMKSWDIYTGQLLHRMNGTQPIAFGAGGLRMAASGGPRFIRLWNVEQGQLLRNLSIPNTNNNRGIEAIAFSEDGQTIAHAMKGESKILVWDVETWKIRYTLEKHSQAIKAIAISPDGKILASSSEDGNINLWDLGTGKFLRSIKGDGAIVFSPDNKQLVSVSKNNLIQLWQIYGSAIEQ